jgi:hypothetical protein
MVEYSPYDWKIHEDPYPVYKRLRDEAPAYYNAELGFWALSRHADVLAAFQDSRRFSNAFGVALEGSRPEANETMSFLALDPPRHDRLRALVSRGFTPRRVVGLEASIRKLAVHYLDEVRGNGGFDFIQDFAGKLPMDVISEMLGVPTEDRDMLRGWADTVVHREEGNPDIPPAGMEAAANMIHYFSKLVTRRRNEPGEDLTAALIDAEIDGDRLSDKEVMAFLFLMVIAGNETTTKLLGNALYWLWKNPAQRAKVTGHPNMIPNWAEETLRYDNSSQMLARALTCDVELHGKTMRKGDKVALLVGAANRDERVFPDPDVYDVTRDCKQSLSFGYGTHFCLGASLARLEARVSLEEVMARFADYEIDPAGLVRVHSSNVRGFSAMPIRCGR